MSTNKATTSPVVTQTDPSGKTDVVPQSGAASSGELNPPHGQPGHRCDIAVGAPLNNNAATPAKTESAQPVQQAPAQPAASTQPAVISQPAAPATEGVKLNPPHGQPGHRCDLQVGAPLQ
ncbi:MAG TPA: hypothetical protein VFZ78_02015 [Flavisolibacter sp.]